MSADNEKDSTRRFHSLIGTSSSSLPKQRQWSPPFPINQLDIPQLNVPQFRSQFRYLPSANAGLDGTCRRAGMPPSHPQIPPISPYSQIPAGRPQTGLQTFTTNPGPSHTRSLSQPSSFAADSLPPLSPSPYRDLPQSSISDRILTDAAMEDVHGSPSPFSWGTSLSRINESLPPGKAHRRSKSDIPFGFMPFVQQPTSPLLMPMRSPVTLDRLGSSIDNSLPSQPVQLIKKECIWEKRVETGNGDGTDEKKSEGEVVDDFFSAYMNLENIEAFNSPGTDEKLGNDNREDLESSRASGTKTNGGDSSDNEATSSVNESLHSKREGVKRNAVEDIAPTPRHYRSMSMDSFMGKMSFWDESLKMPPSPLPMASQLSPTNSLEANSNAFSLEFGNGEFTGVEMKKIMENEKLAEIALSDPKRAKRILANRQSAARSKERKMRYIAELEHKVQTLQTEATTLSAQLTLLQRDSAGLTNQNNELKFRLQAMEQQAQLRDALNEALTAEVQRLKLTTAELTGDTSKFQQLSIGPQRFPSLRQQQAAAQLQHQQQKPLQQSNGNDPKKKNESNK